MHLDCTATPTSWISRKFASIVTAFVVIFSISAVMHPHFDQAWPREEKRQAEEWKEMAAGWDLRVK
jgi:hypothetical protein